MQAESQPFLLQILLQRRSHRHDQSSFVVVDQLEIEKYNSYRISHTSKNYREIELWGTCISAEFKISIWLSHGHLEKLASGGEPWPRRLLQQQRAEQTVAVEIEEQHDEQ